MSDNKVIIEKTMLSIITLLITILLSTQLYISHLMDNPVSVFLCLKNTFFDSKIELLQSFSFQ